MRGMLRPAPQPPQLWEPETPAGTHRRVVLTRRREVALRCSEAGVYLPGGQVLPGPKRKGRCVSPLFLWSPRVLWELNLGGREQARCQP